MADKAKSEYNDRQIGADVQKDSLPKPQLDIIIDGNSVYKPGMKTYFVDDYAEGDAVYRAVVTGSYCTCNLVYVKGEAICTCDTVCPCENDCTCDGYSSSSSRGTTGGGVRSCGGPCACVPVH